MFASAPNRLSILQKRMLLLAVLAGALAVAAHVVPVIRIPFQIDYAEGMMMEGALRLRHSQPLYPDPTTFPVIFHEYGPVAYAAVAAVLPAQQISFSAARCLILICSLFIALLAGSLVRRETGSLALGCSFGMMFLTLPATHLWLSYARSDLIGLAFAMAGITLYLSRNRLYWSVPLFFLAVFCKYTLIAAPVAVFLHLLLRRKTRQAFLFAARLGIASLLAFELLQRTTAHWFAFHMFSIHADPYSLSQYLRTGMIVALSAPVLTVLAVTHLLHSIRLRQASFPAAYLVTSTLTALTAGGFGANTNHFLEWMLACCLCGGLAYSGLLRTRPKMSLPITVLLCTSVLAGVFIANPAPPAHYAGCGQGYEFVRNSPSPRVYADGVGPLLMSGKPVLISDPYAYRLLLKYGSWPDRLQPLLDEKYFGLLVMRDDPAKLQAHGSPIWPDAVVAAINRNYRPVARFNCPFVDVVLQPKP